MIIKNIKNFIKNETVLSIAVILSVISSFIVTPDAQYSSYVDFRTIALLFCLMAVMAGLQNTGVFGVLAESLLKKTHGLKSLSFILVMLCFFFGMLITNDVALITFVPFTVTVLDMLGEDIKHKNIIPIVAMQTVAANLGSMLTPVGNPQNLYLHGISGLGIGEFMSIMMPYTAVSFILLTVWSLLRKNTGVDITFDGTRNITEKVRAGIYAFMFVLCLLTVSRLIDYRITLIIIITLTAVTDRSVFAKVDYTLLLTFIAFFVFVGNTGRIPVFNNYIKHVIDGRECVTGILSSQIISNVPAALLLSGFTDNLKPLIIGVNLGGLGTLIASMASLISFKFIGHENKALRGKYLLYFTAANIVFLAVLAGIYRIAE
ncbi:MAG: citrate transporter [Oscillospiraceae bacterium]|nr:citrate transporter [Oscillospiraceae bacterium]